jgi:hypothetical protein
MDARCVLRSVVLTTVVVLVISCGGGGGGGTPDGNPNGSGAKAGVTTFTFNGGTLDDLKATSSSLEFEDLVIAGELSLPASSSFTIKAKNLTITSAGGVGYGYTDCQYFPAPDVSFSVANNVVVDGSILLSGKSGTRVTDGAVCHSCTGQDGGDIAITGNSIKITGRLSNDGGGGGSFASVGFPDSACSPGKSGNLVLKAGATMDLSAADIRSNAGTNFKSAQAPSGTSDISAGGAFSMNNGNIYSTGAMTFSAASSNICAPIDYGTLSESIGGVRDTSPPTVTVLSPVNNASVPYSQPMTLKVHATDFGMGLKNVRFQGLGRDQTFGCSAFVDGILTAQIQRVALALASAPPTSTTATITAIDNKGNVQSVPVTLHFTYVAEVENNNTIATAQAIDFIQGTIASAHAGAIFSPPPSGLNADKNNQFKIEDFYKVTCCTELLDSSGTVRDRAITLSVDFGAAAISQPTMDIDIYLFNSTGAVIASSVKDNAGLHDYTEHIQLGGFPSSAIGNTFYLGIQAYNVPSAATYFIY